MPPKGFRKKKEESVHSSSDDEEETPEKDNCKANKTKSEESENNESKKTEVLKRFYLETLCTLIIYSFTGRKHNGILNDGTGQTGKDAHSKAAGCDVGLFGAQHPSPTAQQGDFPVEYEGRAESEGDRIAALAQCV